MTTETCGYGRKGNKMLPLYQDDWFTFRFAQARIVPRFHLEGIEARRLVSVFKIDPGTGKRLALLAAATVGDGGWVELKEPIIVRAGDAFIAVPATSPLIRPQTPTDNEAIRHVNRLAFGQDAEAQLVDTLRGGGYVRASLVAEQDGKVVGHVLFSALPIITEAKMVPALALAPMAVLPGYQKQGIGSALIRCGLDICRAQGHRIVIVLGHPHFYQRFGFSSKLTAQLESPYSERESFMVVELIPGALDGIAGRVEYPPPFKALS
jgi:putative acetyltransferase